MVATSSSDGSDSGSSDGEEISDEDSDAVEDEGEEWNIAPSRKAKQQSKQRAPPTEMAARPFQKREGVCKFWQQVSLVTLNTDEGECALACAVAN